VLTSLLALAGWPAVLAETAVRIEGILDSRYSFSDSGKSYRFEVFWEEARWLVRVLEAGRSNQLGHVEHGFEGTNHYGLTYVNTEPWPLASQRTNVILVNGAVRSRQIPSGLDNFLHVYWLAFRGCILPRERPERLPAALVYGTDGRPADWSLPTNYEPGPAQGNAVSRILLFNPGVEYLLGTTNEVPLRPPYDQGYTKAVFAVQRWTTLAHWRFPMHFTWEVFVPRPSGASSNELEAIASCAGRITHFEETPTLASAIPQPPAQAKMAVVDHRFETAVGVKGVYYVTQDGFWNPNSPRFQAEVARLKAAISATGSPKARRWGVMIFGFLFTAGLVAMGYASLKARRAVADAGPAASRHIR
jgi:hypothetical protein